MTLAGVNFVGEKKMKNLTNERGDFQITILRANSRTENKNIQMICLADIRIWNIYISYNAISTLIRKGFPEPVDLRLIIHTEMPPLLWTEFTSCNFLSHSASAKRAAKALKTHKSATKIHWRSWSVHFKFIIAQPRHQKHFRSMN